MTNLSLLFRILYLIYILMTCTNDVMVSSDVDNYDQFDQFDHSSEKGPTCEFQFLSGKSLKEKAGSFETPRYPMSHPTDVTCRYSFQGLDQERVQISFSEIDLQPPSPNHTASCDDVDSVTVNVYIKGQPSVIGIFCGSTRPPQLMSSDNRLEVIFTCRTHSNNREFRGFSATYKFLTVCGFAFMSASSSNGTFTSPNFPGLYPRNTQCHYLFYGRENERIYITFPYFDVEGYAQRCNSDSQSDYIEFSNFNVELEDRKMMRLCGTRSNNAAKNDVISDGNFFRVTFNSNERYDATGFEAFYQFRRLDDPNELSRRMRQSNAASVQLKHSSVHLSSLLMISFYI